MTVPSGGQIVYVDTTNAVATATGWPVAATETLDLALPSGTVLWALVAATTQVVNIIEVGA